MQRLRLWDIRDEDIAMYGAIVNTGMLGSSWVSATQYGTPTLLIDCG